MTILASAIIANCRTILLDPAPGTTWLDADLLTMLNQAERFACNLRPELYTARAAIAMATGIHQTLPAGGNVLMRLDENATSKRRCRLVDSALLDAALATWPATAEATDVVEYAIDAKDRKRFVVYPPNNGTGSVVALYGRTPAALAAVGNAINLDDIYEMALQNFVLGQAYSANTKRQDLAKAGSYATMCEKALGVNAQSTVAVLPKYGNTPGGA